MHGALYVDGMHDAEGDWIAAARARWWGPDCLLSASYDLHGNLSRRVLDNLDMLSAYRTAPHIDVHGNHATGMRHADRLRGYRKVRPTQWSGSSPFPCFCQGREPARKISRRRIFTHS